MTDKYKLKISKDAEDTSSTDVFDSVIDTDFKTFMNKLSGTVDYTFSTSPSDVCEILLATIHHGLGYIPQATVKFSIDNVAWSILPYLFYYTQDQMCPGCVDACVAAWNTCTANADNAYNACVDNAFALYSSCLDAYPYVYPDRWDEWVAGCDAALWPRLDACDANWNAAYQTCVDNDGTCHYLCGDYPMSMERRAIVQYGVKAITDDQDLKIYFQITGHPAPSCGYPAGTFLNMVGRAFHFKYDIGFSELKMEGEQNAGVGTGR